MRVLSIICVAVIFCAACNSNTSRGVLPPEKMQVIMWDLLKADELITENRLTDARFESDSANEALYQKVFLMHETDKATFEKSFRFYQSRPDLSKNILDSVISIGTRERILLTDTAVNLTYQVDFRMNINKIRPVPVDSVLKWKPETHKDTTKLKADTLLMDKRRAMADSLLKKSRMMRKDLKKN